MNSTISREVWDGFSLFEFEFNALIESRSEPENQQSDGHHTGHKNDYFSRGYRVHIFVRLLGLRFLLNTGLTEKPCHQNGGAHTEQRAENRDSNCNVNDAGSGMF